MSELRDVTKLKLTDRVRTDLGKKEKGIAALANSMKVVGQLHNIVVEGEEVRAGGRRYLACLHLASIGSSIGGDLPEGDPRRYPPGIIRVVDYTQLTPYERALIEREENFGRKDFTAGEEAMAISRVRDALAEHLGRNPTKAEISDATGGKSVGQISMGLQVAKRILEGNTDLANAKSVAGAYRQSKAQDQRAAVVKRLAGVKPMDRTLAERLTCCDAVVGIKQFENGFFDFINFDPPWGIGIDDYDRHHKYEAFDDDPLTWERVILPLIPELYRVLRQDSFMVAWFGEQYQEKFREALNTLSGTVRAGHGFDIRIVPSIWYKKNKGGAINDPSQIEINVYEPFFVCSKGDPRIFSTARTNVLSYDLPSQKERIHPTQKSVDVMQDILERYSYGPMRVYDPTFGSGAFFIACRRLGRQFWGHDKSEHNVKQAINWIRTFDLDDKGGPNDAA